MSSPYNVLRVNCNVEPADTLEVGTIVNPDADHETQQVYFRIEDAEDSIEVNITRREACALANRILAEFSEPSSYR